MEAQHTPDITTGFIQMVEAYKVKPELEAKINRLEQEVDANNTAISSYNDRVRELEARLAAAAQDKERLTRERDDAMFRSLELEEKTKSVSDLVAKLETLVRPEPVAQAEAPVEQPMAQVDVEQRDVGREPYGDHTQSNIESFPRPEYSGQGQSEGVSTSGEGKPYTPNWDSPTKAEQNATESVASTNVTNEDGYYAMRERETPEGSIYDRNRDEYQPKRHENHGKPYYDKPWWVNDNDWKSQGGQGPHEGGSWQAPWERQA